MFFNETCCIADYGDGASDLELDVMSRQLEDLAAQDFELADVPFYSFDRILQRQEKCGLLPFQSFLDQVEFVSLGNYCILSLALKAMGLRKCAYPLDYVRSSVDGVIHLFSTNFADFLTGNPVPTNEGVSYQNTAWGGSFWHHDISEQEVRNSMQRRVERLLGHKDVPKAKPRVFCRTVNSTDELDLTFALYSVLRATYTGPVKLLTIVENQVCDGPMCIQGNPDLLFYRINQNHTMTSQLEERVLGFVEPLATAVRFWAGDSVHVSQVQDVPQVKSFCDSIEGGDPATTLFAPTQLQQAIRTAPAPQLTQLPPLVISYQVPGSPKGQASDDEYETRALPYRNFLAEQLSYAVETYLSVNGFTCWTEHDHQVETV